MTDRHRLRVDVPASLMAEIESLASSQDVDVSELLDRALRMYVKRERRREVREFLRRGYQEMADLNLTLAQESQVDNHIWGRATDQQAEGEGSGH